MCATGLLNRVHQLVRQQSSALGATWGVLSRREYHVATEGVGTGVQSVGRLGSC
jgi:hypothetical protein